nr:MAG TPA: hypothetical protein [Caudoviricetes sp.]
MRGHSAAQIGDGKEKPCVDWQRHCLDWLRYAEEKYSTH